MSRNTKTYGKRGASGPITSIQFDKSITDNTKRPSASKSAGVVGKWGTTSFTSLRSSQVNGVKTGKRGMSPVKCFPAEYSSPNPATPISGTSAFNFSETAVNSSAATATATASAAATATVSVQPKPRKFFKSRGTEDPSKTQIPILGSSSAPPSSYSEFQVNHTDYSSHSHLYSAAAGGVGYIVPPASAVKSPVKRGRGRPRGSRSTSPRGLTPSSFKPPKARGGPRGRPRLNRGVRGQHGVGRGKRKKEWEESESEEEVLSSDPEDIFEPELEIPRPEPMEDAVDEEEEEEDEEEEEEEAEEQVEELEEAEKQEEPVEHQPPIKLRIIRTNTDAFVSKVNVEGNEISEETEATPPTDNKNVNMDPPVDFDDIASAPTPPEQPEEPESKNEDVEMDTNRDSDDLAAIEAIVKEPVFAPTQPTVDLIPSEDSSVVELLVPNIQMQKKSSIFKSRFHSVQGTSGSNSSVNKETVAVSKGRKGLALYRHKWHEDETRKGAAGTTGEGAMGSAGNASPSTISNSAPCPWDDMGEDESPNSLGPLVKIPRVHTWPGSSKTSYSDEGLDGEEPTTLSLKCARKAKDYYTVVRNVKKAHQIQESGEFQEFNDDVDYILDALQAQNPTATRCLSAMSLASKCMEPAFRMHLRAHSTVAKFFQALKDAPSKASVALCTSCIMFVLTQDRLNMDLDRDSLELMLNLLEIDTGIGQVDIVEVKELEKNKLKVRELCEEMVRKGHAPHLQLDKITAAQLAMETLLSLTSKKAGEWFKEELRVLGGLDHIIQTVTLCTTALTTPYGDPAQSILQWNWDKLRLDALKKVDRCLRVLENVTFQNEENQNYLLEYSDGRLVDATLKLLELLAREVIAYSPPVSKDSLGHLLSEALTNLMKVIMNLTHDSNDDSLGSRAYGENPLTWQTALTCLLNTSPCLPEEKRFDVTTLSLGILINLVERSVANREKLLAAPVPYGSDEVFGQKVTSLSALINLFIAKEESARLEEARTDEILDGKPPTGANGGNSSQSLNSGNNDNPSNANNKQEDAMEETVKKLLHKAGRHMEDSMVAAYVGLLIGYIVMKNKDYELKVKELLPNQKFTMMIVVLKKFYEFLKLTANAVTSTRGLKNTELVIKFMEASDKSSSAVPKEETCSSLSDDDDM